MSALPILSPVNNTDNNDPLISVATTVVNPASSTTPSEMIVSISNHPLTSISNESVLLTFNVLANVAINYAGKSTVNDVMLDVSPLINVNVEISTSAPLATKPTVSV